MAAENTELTVNVAMRDEHYAAFCLRFTRGRRGEVDDSFVPVGRDARLFRYAERFRAGKAARAAAREESKPPAVPPPPDKLQVCEVFDSGLKGADVGVDLRPPGRPRAWANESVDDFIRSVTAWFVKRKKRMAYSYERRVGMVKKPEPKTLTIASLCNHLRISTRTFERWCADEEHRFWGVCQQVRTAVEADLWDSKDPMAKLLLQSRFGHKSRADVTTDDKEMPPAAGLNIDPSKLSTKDLQDLVKLARKGAVEEEV